jgi:prepilin-type processing-associated H-X9-DG protein
MTRSASPDRTAVTLLECLVVCGLVAVLLGLLLPAVQKARETAQGARCAHHLRQLGVASHLVHDTYGRLPPAWGWFPQLNITNGTAGIGPVFFHLLPGLEEENLYLGARHRAAAPSQDYLDYALAPGDRQLGLYSCPLDPSLPAQGGAPGITPYGGSSYAANFLIFGITGADFQALHPSGRPRLPQSVPDGTSKTILFAEKYAVADWLPDPHDPRAGLHGGCHWAYWGNAAYVACFALYDPRWTDANAVGPVGPGDPRDSRFQVRPPPGRVHPGVTATGHAGGLNVCLADGSVHLLGKSLAPPLWWALVTPAGREAVGVLE